MELTEQILTKDGCPIHYWIRQPKTGSWLVFLHGACADHRMFAEQLKVVDDACGLLLWDARGQGLSRPIGNGFTIRLLMDDLLSILDREGIAQATLIGQSMGGNLAQEIAFHHPEKVESMVLIDCTWNMQKLTVIEKLSLKMAPFLFALYPWKTLVRQSAQASSVKPEVRKYLVEVFGIVGARDFVKILLEATACLHEEPDYHIGQPFLLLCGEHDVTGNIRKIAPVWAKREPQCDFHWIKDAGHCANQDNPEAVNELLANFLLTAEAERRKAKRELND